MIDNKNDPEITEGLHRARRRLPAAIALLEALEAHPQPFTVTAADGGLEVEATTPVENRPNRAVLKVFEVADGPQAGRTALFFYKRSQVPFSRDRHAYGAAFLPATGTDPGEVAAWLDFAASGFHPELRPPRLRRAITFTVPD